MMYIQQEMFVKVKDNVIRDLHHTPHRQTNHAWWGDKRWSRGTNDAYLGIERSGKELSNDRSIPF